MVERRVDPIYVAALLAVAGILLVEAMEHLSIGLN